MILLPDNDLHKFRIKQLQKGIDAQLKAWRDEELLKYRYTSIKQAWEDIYLNSGFDDRQLWLLKFELERQIYGVN